MTTTKSFLEQIGNLIGRDELSEAIQLLHNLLKDNPKLDEAIIQSARYNDVTKQIRLGTIDAEQANITKNQIRFAVLDLLREIEAQGGQPVIREELSNYLIKQHSGMSEYDLFFSDIQQYEYNINSTTSSPLMGKTVEHLDQRHLKKLFLQRFVRQHFAVHKVKSNEDLNRKLKILHLIANGFVIKGTFLCLANIDQIRSVSRTAYQSRFFSFEDLRGMRTRVVELVSGNLIEQFEQIKGHISANLYLHRDIDTRTDDYEIPEGVFTELLANAFIHSDYSDDAITGIKVELYPDRLEITNPGTMLPQILNNLENNSISKLSNLEIVQTFFLHEFIETAGKGIARIQKTLKERRMSPAIFEQNEGYIKVTVNKYKKPKINPFLEKAHDLLDKKDIPTFFELIEQKAGKSEELLLFKKQFISQESDDNFYQRLKVFASTVLPND